MKRFLAFLSLPVLCLSFTFACDVPDRGQVERPMTSRATQADFLADGVGLVFEKRCGSLDCHGSSARNMRIYSSDGLRLANEAGIATGTSDTTADERLANYQSILGVEPRATTSVLNGGDPYTMLVVKKPLLIESHKGGQVIRRGDDAETCIVSWLTAEAEAGTPTNATACASAADFPHE